MMNVQNDVDEIGNILDDLHAAEKITRQFERKYWLRSSDFYALYSQGALDDGENLEDFTIWSGFYEIKLLRERELNELSEKRIEQLPYRGKMRVLNAPEPLYEFNVV